MKCFFTCYFDSELQYWVADPKRIAIKYLKTWFLIDFISIMPFDSLGIMLGSDDMSKFKAARVIRLLRLLKLLRLLRSLRILNRYQDQMGWTALTRTSVRFSLAMMTATHWMACTLKLIPDIEAFKDEDGNAFSWLNSTLNDETVGEADPSRQYSVSLYWATSTISTIGYGDVSATTGGEAAWMTICMFVSCVLYTYTLGEVVNLVGNVGEASRVHNKLSDMLNDFCMQQQVPKKLAMRLREYFRHTKDVHNSQYQQTLFKFMSPTLRGEVLMFLNEKFVRSCKFLHADDVVERRRFIMALSMQMDTRVFGPQETVIALGDR
jgi:potassium voltage-gated channel Eag-related subfamily H protein 7